MTWVMFLIVITMTMGMANASICNDSYVNVTHVPSGYPILGPDRFTVGLYPNRSVTVNVIVNITQLPNAPVDCYILWDVSYSSRLGFSRFFMNHLFPPYLSVFKNIADGIVASHASGNVRFAMGFFTNKRLPGLGNSGDFVYRHIANFTNNTGFINTFLHDSSFNFYPPVTSITSSIEALMQTILRQSTNFGSSSNTRRVILLATDRMFGIRGDIVPRMTSAFTYIPGGDIFPLPNDNDAVMENDCQLYGNICPGIHQSSNCNLVPLGNVYNLINTECRCGSGMSYSTNPIHLGILNSSNIGQFGYGSCEDYPTQKNVSAIGKLHGINLAVFLVPSDPSRAVSINSSYAQLVDDFGGPPRNRLFHNMNTFYTDFTNFMAPGPLLPPVITHNISTLVSYTYGTCSVSSGICNISFTFLHAPGGNGSFPIFVHGAGIVNVTVEICPLAVPPVPAPQSMSLSDSQSTMLTDSQSTMLTDSQSTILTDSQSTILSDSQSMRLADSQSMSLTESVTESSNDSDHDSSDDSINDSSKSDQNGFTNPHSQTHGVQNQTHISETPIVVIISSDDDPKPYEILLFTSIMIGVFVGVCACCLLVGVLGKRRKRRKHDNASFK